MPLGANLVLLATAGPVGDELPTLLPVTHARAVDGVSLTTLGVGAQADADALAQLALAGQGRRRLVAHPAEARQVVDEELNASGRVVARAVRLRIRLAEGVKLVEVLGSQPLDNLQTDRVREAEQAADRRLATTLGIDADRGEDEDGIQIVIPAFYAGDDHVVLLDVVVAGPGPVADVQVRYKDLVNLRNAVARARLVLPAGALAETPLTGNVRKNVLAYRLSTDLVAAGAALAGGDANGALGRVQRAGRRLAMLQEQMPELRDDPELRRDSEMLASYVTVLADWSAWLDDAGVRGHVARSLTYAGRVKLPPEPRD